jgi:hypothetical protein
MHGFSEGGGIVHTEILGGIITFTNHG